MVDWVLHILSSNSVGVLFLILVTGLMLGQIRVFGLNLGSSGVLFTSLVAGHYGLIVPGIYGSLGVIFFVYAVGLQAGPRFVHTIRSSGPSLVRIGLLIIGAGAGTAVLLGKGFGFSPGMIVGAFAGAMTSTPALAAGLEVFRETNTAELAVAAVSYGLAYPFGVAMVVLPVQIIPKLFRNRGDHKRGASNGAQQLDRAAFRVENPNIDGRTVAEANLWDFASISLSRVLHNDDFSIVLGSTILHAGDTVIAVGNSDELDKLVKLIGPRTDVEPLVSAHDEKLITREVSVGPKAPRHLSTAMLAVRYSVSITRIYRMNFSLTVGRDTDLEPGDRIRAVGTPENLDSLEKKLGHSESSIFETDMLGLMSGLVAGVILGLIPWQISSSMAAVKLGLAGGPLFISLLVGHFGRIGPMSNRIPASARFLLRELGLVLFLAYAGTKAGEKFIVTLQQSGIEVLFASLIIVLIPVLLGFFVSYYVYKYELTFALGLICGGMTSTPALGALVSSLRSQEPALGYAAIYPLSLIAVTVVSQLMALLL
jgi:putative transport protein